MRARGCSLPLQRAIVDFGADGSFAEAAGKKMPEHYGITVPVSTARLVTLNHAAAMEAEQKEAKAACELPQGPGAERIIAEMDGCNIPIVIIAPQQKDEPSDDRKRRELGWIEARLPASKVRQVSAVGNTCKGSPLQAVLVRGIIPR